MIYACRSSSMTIGGNREYLCQRPIAHIGMHMAQVIVNEETSGLVTADTTAILSWMRTEHPLDEDQCPHCEAHNFVTDCESCGYPETNDLLVES